MNRILALVIGLFALTAASTAQAFPHLYMWVDPGNGHPSQGLAPGAGYLYGTGGAKERGITCALCHVKAPGTIGVTVNPSVPWQVVGNANAYKPGQQYTITVTMTGETKNPGTTDNFNGFALTIENAAGVGVGTFSNDQAANPVTTTSCTNTRVMGAAEMTLATNGVTTYLISANSAGGGCYTVVAVPKLGATSWTFKWTAPAAGAGPVTIYYGVVDGDHAGTDSKNDDVKQGTIRLNEGT